MEDERALAAARGAFARDHGEHVVRVARSLEPPDLVHLHVVGRELGRTALTADVAAGRHPERALVAGLPEVFEDLEQRGVVGRYARDDAHCVTPTAAAAAVRSCRTRRSPTDPDRPD